MCPFHPLSISFARSGVCRNCQWGDLQIVSWFDKAPIVGSPGCYSTQRKETVAGVLWEEFSILFGGGLGTG